MKKIIVYVIALIAVFALGFGSVLWYNSGEKELTAGEDAHAEHNHGVTLEVPAPGHEDVDEMIVDDDHDDHAH